MKKQKINRRQFIGNTLKVTAGGLLVPTIVPHSVFGKNAPSNQITIGCIGLGNMGNSNLNAFLQHDDVRVVAVCDLDAVRLEKAKRKVDGEYENTDCAYYHDFRDLIARDDIDAVSIATPDHWHAIPAVMAAKSGKDIYGEKPLSHNFAEGQAMVKAVQRYNRIWQTGSWQRSRDNFHFASELVRNGFIGHVKKVEVGLPGGVSARNAPIDMTPKTPPPELDYNFWIGPAPYVPYFEGRTHWNWRWQLAFGGGQLLDWVGHHVDIAHWGLGLDRTGPVEIEGKGEYMKTGPWDAASRYKVYTKYKNGLPMTISGGYDEIRFGVKWIGEDGWIWVTRGDMETYPESLMRVKLGPNHERLYKSVDHHQNFIDCVKSRRETITPCEVAHRSATPGHLGQIAMRLERKIYFDPDKEIILNDDKATQMLSRPMRRPWQLS